MLNEFAKFRALKAAPIPASFKVCSTVRQGSGGEITILSDTNTFLAKKKISSAIFANRPEVASFCSQALTKFSSVQECLGFDTETGEDSVGLVFRFSPDLLSLLLAKHRQEKKLIDERIVAKVYADISQAGVVLQRAALWHPHICVDTVFHQDNKFVLTNPFTSDEFIADNVRMLGSPESERKVLTLAKVNESVVQLGFTLLQLCTLSTDQEIRTSSGGYRKEMVREGLKMINASYSSGMSDMIEMMIKGRWKGELLTFESLMHISSIVREGMSPHHTNSFPNSIANLVPRSTSQPAGVENTTIQPRRVEEREGDSPGFFEKMLSFFKGESTKQQRQEGRPAVPNTIPVNQSQREDRGSRTGGQGKIAQMSMTGENPNLSYMRDPGFSRQYEPTFRNDIVDASVLSGRIKTNNNVFIKPTTVESWGVAQSGRQKNPIKANHSLLSQHSTVFPAKIPTMKEVSELQADKSIIQEYPPNFAQMEPTEMRMATGGQDWASMLVEADSKDRHFRQPVNITQEREMEKGQEAYPEGFRNDIGERDLKKPVAVKTTLPPQDAFGRRPTPIQPSNPFVKGKATIAVLKGERFAGQEGYTHHQTMNESYNELIPDNLKTPVEDPFGRGSGSGIKARAQSTPQISRPLSGLAMLTPAKRQGGEFELRRRSSKDRPSIFDDPEERFGNISRIERRDSHHSIADLIFKDQHLSRNRYMDRKGSEDLDVTSEGEPLPILIDMSLPSSTGLQTSMRGQSVPLKQLMDPWQAEGYSSPSRSSRYTLHGPPGYSSEKHMLNGSMAIRASPGFHSIREQGYPVSYHIPSYFSATPGYTVAAAPPLTIRQAGGVPYQNMHSMQRITGPPSTPTPFYPSQPIRSSLASRAMPLSPSSQTPQVVIEPSLANDAIRMFKPTASGPSESSRPSMMTLLPPAALLPSRPVEYEWHPETGDYWKVCTDVNGDRLMLDRVRELPSAQ